jgi:hypothetical protein
MGTKLSSRLVVDDRITQNRGKIIIIEGNIAF